MNLSLTTRHKQYVKQKVASGHYGSASEVIREALRVLEELETERDYLEQLMDEADASAAIRVTAGFWKKLDAKLRREHQRREHQRRAA